MNGTERQMQGACGPEELNETPVRPGPSVIGWLGRARRFFLPLLFLAVLLGGSLEPKPVAAANLIAMLFGAQVGDSGKLGEAIKEGISQALEAMKEIAEWMNIVKGFKFMKELWNKFLNAIEEAWKSLGKTSIAASQAMAKARAKTAQAQSDAWAATGRISMAAEFAQKNPGTVRKPQSGGASSGGGGNAGAPSVKGAALANENEFLCFTVTARQIIPVMVQFRDIISDWLMTRYMTEGRGKGEDGNGPAYAAKERRQRLGKASPGDPVAVHPADGTPGVTPEDDPPGKSTNFSTYADADLTVPRPGKTSLIVPDMKSEEVEYPDGTKRSVSLPVANKDEPKERLWVLNADFCARAAGPRPTGPVGKDQDTPGGMIKTAKFNHCLALQSAFLKQCSDRVAYMSRPHCKNSDFRPFCEEAQKGCLAALAHNIILPDSFDNCQKGLSLYEAEYISNILCMSNGRYIGKANAGAMSTEMMASSQLCALSMAVWQRKQQAEEANLMKAIRGLHAIKDCWAGVDAR